MPRGPRGAHRPPRTAARAGCLVLLAALAACGVAEDAQELQRPAPVAATGAAHVGPIPVATLPSLGPFLPRDDAASLPEVRAIRDSLLAIVARRDSAALLAMVAPDVKLGFGGDDGIANARATWFAADRDPDVWHTLTDLLTHGGEGDSTQFTAPYWFTGRLPEAADPFEALVVIDSATVVRDAPDSTAAPLGTLGLVVVRGADAAAPAGWTALTLDSARVGYVRSAQVRSPIGWRLRLEKHDGRWWIVFLVAGD